MALPYEIVSLGGHNIGPGTGYGAHLDARDDFPVTIGLNTTQRHNAPPTVDSITIDGRVIPMRLSREGSIVSEATFHTNVQQWCNPYAMTAGPVTLVMYAVDGTTQISAPVYVTGRAPIQGEPWSYAVTLYLANPALEATTPTVASSSPIVNAGSMTALPSVAFTSATHKTWRPSTVSGAGYGGGMTSVPVQFALNSATATTTNVFVYVNGVSVPCFVGGGSSATAAVYALIDTAADGSNTVVDIVYGSSLVNPLAGTLLDFGRMFGSSTATVMTNTAWRWDDWSSVLTNPRKVPGVWYPAVTGAHLNPDTAVGFAASASQIDLTPTAAGTGLIYDSIVMVIPPGAAASSTIPANSLKRLTDASFANARMYVKYKTAGNPNWQTAWSTTSASQTIATALNVPDAILIAIGVESTSATLAPAGTASIAFGSLGYLQITLANGASVTLGSSANLDYYNGVFAIGPNQLSFPQEFDNAAWTKLRSSVTANATTAPDGQTTADFLKEDATASASHEMSRVITPTTALANGQQYTVQVFAKAATRTQLSVFASSYAGFQSVFANAMFDLSAGTVLSTAAGTASITPVPGQPGWYVCAVTGTVAGITTDTQLTVFYNLASGGSNTYSGDNTSGLYLWDARLIPGGPNTAIYPSIAFSAFMVADGTLTVDADAKTLTPSVVGSPMFGLPTWSDDDSWLAVQPGSNVVTNTTGGSFTITISSSFT